MTWLKANGRSTLLAILIPLTSLGCSSTAPVDPRLRPTEFLEIDPQAWEFVEDHVILPYTELREILANRRRWINYSKALEQ